VRKQKKKKCGERQLKKMTGRKQNGSMARDTCSGLDWKEEEKNTRLRGSQNGNKKEPPERLTAEKGVNDAKRVECGAIRNSFHNFSPKPRGQRRGYEGREGR